jgi:holliday junction DNA helicase RuvA
MIARLHGTLADKHPGLVVVDVGGVGYELTIPLSTYRHLGEIGAPVELHVHTHVREDTLALYGFASRIEKELFVRLVAVNGVGPKTAVALLSGLGADDLVEAVRVRDVRRLATVPGIGRKTAERIAIELADRLDALAAPAGVTPERTAARIVRDDLVSALVNLGYNARSADDAAEKALAAGASPGAVPVFEAALKRALRSLAR